MRTIDPTNLSVARLSGGRSVSRPIRASTPAAARPISLTISVEEASEACKPVAPPAEARVTLATLPFDPPEGTVAAVRVIAAITHTIGGLQVDERARVIGADGLWAAGVDAGGIATGGYASGLAQALVQGLVAAEDVARG